MTTNTLTAGTISAVAGIVLSLALSYVPGLNQWFDKQTGTTKRLVVLACLVVVTAGALTLGCTAILPSNSWATPATCSTATITDAIAAFIAALVSSQSAYQLQPQP
jgi:multisubunit Na+/H+ antiporter MnhB subunit